MLLRRRFKMVALLARWRRWRWRFRSDAVLLLCVVAVATALWVLLSQPVLDTYERDKVKSSIDVQLYEALMQERGLRRHCEVPNLDPYAKEMTKFDKKVPKITCPGRDWVKCYHSKCKIVDPIKETFTDIKCTYRDILYHGDFNYTIGPARERPGDEVHELRESDHAKVSCRGRKKDRYFKTVSWSGNVIGFRPITLAPVPPGREDTYNVLIFSFDSTSRYGFIRNMPKSWKVLNDMGFTVMEGYNIVGDGTPAALFPILTGKTELELPDVRKSENNNRTLDDFPFIFYKLKKAGYRTAFFEDRPDIGTFQYRLNGFHRQPADHYLRAFHLEEEQKSKWSFWKKDRFCLGDTPQFKVMINVTQQFLAFGGKRFIFTFIVGITHDEAMIQVSDDDTAEFLQSLQVYLEDTLVIVMSDHGPRFTEVRDSLQGKLEERLPIFALRLPSRLAQTRANAQRALRANARALCTPHDVHATILDVLDMRQLWSPFKVRGAELTRGLTMLEPIPHTRSCSEAGIEPHWCSCLSWQNVSSTDPFYQRPAVALVDYINSLVAEVGDLCVPRTLKSTAWLLRLDANDRLLSFARARDKDAYVGYFVGKTKAATENYQTKIAVGPGHGIFEATVIYHVKEDKFEIDTRSISRTNAYHEEPACISKTYPRLNPYCYCR